MRYCLNYFLLAASAAAVMACGGGSTSDGRPSLTADSAQLKVVTTIYPLSYMVGRVGGADANVHSLVGPGVEAHAFEPTPSDIQALSAAQLVVANGLNLEPWLGRVIDSLGADSLPVVLEASDIGGFDPLEGGDDEVDPHVWLDPVLAQAQVARIRDTMSELNPDAAQRYAERARELIDELATVHQEYLAGLSACGYKHFVTTHAAYAYLAGRYGLEQIAISGVTAEDEPTPQDLAELTERVKELGLRYVMVEPVIGPRLAETVAAEHNLEFLQLHQMESATAEELAKNGDYVGLMRDNLANLRIALSCSSG